MGRRGPFRLGIALAVVLVAQQTLAGEVCRSGCQGAPQHFKYAEGTTYKYNYEGKTEITLSSAEGQTTGTDVKAVVLLTQQPDCNQIIRLQNVQISTSNGKKLGHIPDVEKPIRLNFHDGRIEDSICVEPGDSQNSINIKRAVASLFQANFKNSYETDVFGVCPTETAHHKEGNILVVQKSRNLNKCAYRENLKQDFFSTTFNPNSEIKSSPILDGDYSAKLRIKNGILEQTNVIENYLYTPFSVGKNGAKAQVISSLHFVGTSKDNPRVQVSQPRSIIFENPHPVVSPTSNVNSILSAVKEVVKSIDVVVGEQTAKEFVTLVKSIRASKKDDLLAVYNQVKSGVGFGDKAVAKKAFLDALLQAATGDSVEVGLTLLKNNELNEEEKLLVYIGLSFTRHATESSLNAAAVLLNQPNLRYEAYLGIGNLAGRFCSQHSCDNVDAVNKLAQKLVQKLDGRHVNRKEENDVIYALKALANFRYLSDSAVPKLIAVAQNKKASNRLRAAAFETYLADPCKDKLRDSALKVLQDYQQDSEVRIKAYLALAQCPNAKIGNAVKELLEKEPSYQVGSFISTHIRNLKSSANPDKDLAKQYLGFSLPQKFPVDFRKWSYNGEFSYAVDSLGVAASTETNIIYSQDSFLPRSSSLNLTAEVFGHTFNFLEIKTRQENLDKLVEHYFGPKGLLRTSSLGDLLKSNSETASKLWNYIDNRLNSTLRTRRDVSRAEIENIGKAVQIKEQRDLDLDLSVKVFGSEIVFTNLNVYHNVLTPEALIDKYFQEFGKRLDSLKQFEEIVRSNLLFLDVEFSYPTGLGFPLRLAVEGTSNVQVKSRGSVDVRSILAGRDTNIKVELIPSANIEVAGRLTLDALLVENGLKIVSTLYAATGGDLNINLFNNRKGLDVKFGLPVQEQKLIQATHEIVFHTREPSGHETNLPLKFAQAKDFSICLDQLSPFIGLTFCAEMNGPNLAGQQVPNLPFPLAGDSKISVTVENDDVREYHLRNVVNNDQTSAEIVVETIGKNGQKKVSFQVNAEISPEKYIKAIFTSPIKTASAEARLTTNPREKSLSLRLGHDNVEFFGKLGVEISGSPSRAVYKPILEYKAPGGAQQLPVNVQGQIVVEQNGPHVKYIFENTRITLPDQRTISLQGHVGNDGQDLFTDLTVSEGRTSGSLKGRLHADPNLLRFNAEVRNSINPNANFHIKGEFKKGPAELSSNLQLTHGPDLSSKTNIITLVNTVINKYKGPQDFLIGTKNHITYPLAGIDSKFDFEQNPKAISYDLSVQYAEIKFGSNLKIGINLKEEGDFEVDIGVFGLDNNVKFSGNRQVQGDESKISNCLEVNGKKLEVNGNIKHHVKPSNVDVGAELVVNLPSHNTPFQVSSGLKYNPNELDAHHKVTSGNTVIIDAFLKATKGLNANGSVKVNIKDLLIVNGHLKANKGNGNAEILIDAQNVKKQVKLESTFQIQPTTYNVVLTLYPAFGQDKKQKIIFSTHNRVTHTNLDSKNYIDLLGKKLEFNLKGTKTGDKDNGKVNGEFDITLPNEQYLLGKLNCDHSLNNELRNGHSLTSLEYRKNKNAAGRKVSVKTTYRNTNPKEGLYDVEYNLAADDSNGKNINADIGFKSSKTGETRNLALSNKIFGSILKNPLEAKLHMNCKQGVGEYDVSTTYGPNAVLKVNGKYDLQGPGKPISGSVQIEVTTPSKGLKTLKAGASGSFVPRGPSSEQIELQGSASLFATDASKPDPLIDFNSQGEIRVSEKNGEIKGNLKFGKIDPISAVASYSCNENGDQKQINGKVDVQYGQGKNVRAQATLDRLNKQQYKLEAEFNSPTAEYKNTKLVVTTKRSEANDQVSSTINVVCDGKEWNLETELRDSDLTPLIDIKLRCPEGKRSQFYLKGNKVSDKEFGGELKILHEKENFLLEGDLDANVNNIEEFFVKANINSPALKLDKVVLEAHNKPGKTGRRIQIVVKSAGKNLVTGSTSYQAREEHGKYIVEGSGAFKIKEETKSANFKYIVQRLTLERNGEQGVEVSFDAGLGNKAIDAEFKATNKQFRILNSYCEEKKECAHIEIDAKTNTNNVDEYNNELEINVDLRKLGLSHEFGLKSVTNRKEYVLDHTVDIHFQSHENSKYQYSVYLHPTEAGVILTTPRRIVALESNLNVPKNFKENGGKVSGEVAFYLDKKNEPNKKAAISGWLAIDPQTQAINGETKLSHPGLQRTLSTSIKTVRTGTPTNGEVTITADFDVFAQPGQKLVLTYKSVRYVSEGRDTVVFKETLTAQSRGLGVDILAYEETNVDKSTFSGGYTAKVEYRVGNSNYKNDLAIKVGKREFNFLLRILNVDLLKVNNKLSLNKEEQIIDSEISSYNNNPLVSQLEVKNLNTLRYTIGFKNTPRDKLQFHSGLIPSQIADVRADHVTGSGKTNLFHATLKLDDANFFKPDYSINSKEIESVLENGKKHFSDYLNGLQGLSNEWSNDIRKEVTQLGELSKRAAPNLQPVRNYYASEAQKIKNEILADKSLQELGELLKKTFGAAAQSIGEIFAKLSELIESICHSIQVAFASIIESIDRELIPQLKEVAEKLTAVAADIATAVVELASGYLSMVSQMIEKYQPEIKQLAATFGELGQDVGRFIQKAYENARTIVIEQWQRICNEIQALPIFDEVKAAFEEFRKNLPSNEGLINGLRELAATVKDIVPPDFICQKEISDIVDLWLQYLEKKINGEQVDDVAVLERIVAAHAALVKKVLSAFSSPSYDVKEAEVPVSLDFLKKLPKLVAIKFSPIAHLLKEDTSEEIIAFVLSLLNNPRQWFAPFPLFAMVIQGQHIFTFDGKHLTFPGNCKYLLARDAVNGNFTLVGTYSNGQLAAITLADNTDSITIKAGGQVLLNNAPADLPVRKPELAAYRTYEEIILKSVAGIKVDCTPDLEGCAVSISGFYHAQIRGLLGNGNNEPYDDFTLPNGNIVINEGDFGNAYKIGKCQPVAVPQHDQHQENPQCNKLFGWESPLRFCYPFVKTDNFKLACAHGLAAGVKDMEAAVAKAYVAVCEEHNIPVQVPSELLKCTNGEKPFSVGERFSVKVPSKSADIVLLVDTVKANEPVYKDLVQPLIQEIGKDLHSKGINDVEFHLITYGGENKWPTHVTVNGKLTFKGKAPNVKFSEAPKEEEIRGDGVLADVKPILEALEGILYDLKLAFGQTLEARTYTEGLNYPFRANAAKSIIVVTSKPCEIGQFYVLQVLRTLLYRNNQITLNLITPFQALSVKDPKKSKDIVGFNDEHVFSVSQAKKKPEGSAELYKELRYDDYCVDFTLKNRGNVFVTDNFVNGKADLRKQFIHIAGHNIVDQLTNVEEGLDCECVMINPYHAQNVCEEVYAKEKPAAPRKTAVKK